MHQWLFDNRFLVLLPCLAGLGWSGFLYYRIILAWQSSKTKPKSRRRARVGSKAKLAAQQPEELNNGPLPRTTSINGEQADLLAAMDDKSTVGDTSHKKKAYQSTHIIRQQPGGLVEPSSRDTGPRPSEIIRQLQDREPARDILDQVEAAAAENEAPVESKSESDPTGEEAFSTTEKFRTTRQLHATHEAEDQALETDNEMPATNKDVPLGERETVRSLSPAWLDEQESLRSVELPEPPPGLTQQEADRWREEQRQLKGLAEEGRRNSEPLPIEPGADKAIHRGYEPPDQAAISALEKAKRLEELGLHHSINNEQATPAVIDKATQRDNSSIAENLDEQQRKRLSELGLTDLGDAGENNADSDAKRLVTAELDGILARLDAALDADENLADEGDDKSNETDQSIGNALDDALGDDDDLPNADSIEEAIEEGVSAALNAALGSDNEDDDHGNAEANDASEGVSETDEAKPANDLPSWARIDTFDEDLPEDKSKKDDDKPDEPQQRSLFE